MTAALWSPEAERELLAALALAGREAWLRVQPLGLTPAALSPEHRGAWQVLAHLASTGTPATPATVEFAVGLLGLPDDPTEILDLAMQSLGTLEGAAGHGRIVAELAQRRQLLEVSERMQVAAMDRAIPVDEVVREQFGVLTARRAATTESADALSQALDWLDRRQESGQTPLGVLTGIAGLDEALDGLFPGRLVTIAARPGNGKSDFAVWIAHHAARAGVPVLFESLEMPGYEVWERRLSLAMKLDLKREAREGRWSQHRAKVLAGRDRLEAMPLVLKESDNAVADMALEVYRMASENRRPKVVIVDHLGWVRHDAPKTRAHHHAVGDTCKALKTLAKQEDLCVVLLVQLNRESVKGGTATRPSLAHLADSGEIERDSDQVVFLWEPDPPETPSAEAAMEFVVAKNRGGRLARIEVDWSKATHRYAERPWMPRMVAA